MAAGTWKVFNLAKLKIGNGTLSLSATAFRLALFTSASNLKTSASALPLGTYNSLTNEVANGNNYATGGYALTGEDWTSGRSAKEYKFTADNLTFTASGGTIANIKLAAIYISAAASANRRMKRMGTITAIPTTIHRVSKIRPMPPSSTSAACRTCAAS